MSLTTFRVRGMADVVWFEYQLVRVCDGPKIAETRPDACPNGHPLKAGGCIISVGEHAGGRYRTWECRQCGAITWGRRRA